MVWLDLDVEPAPDTGTPSVEAYSSAVICHLGSIVLELTRCTLYNTIIISNIYRKYRRYLYVNPIYKHDLFEIYPQKSIDKFGFHVRVCVNN